MLDPSVSLRRAQESRFEPGVVATAGVGASGAAWEIAVVGGHPFVALVAQVMWWLCVVALVLVGVSALRR